MYIPILIVGGGPTGLTSSILLSRCGIPSLLIERHAGTSIHPKATGISTRTMEIFRQTGIESRIRELDLDVEFLNSVRHSLAAPEVERRSLGYPDRASALTLSPTTPAVLAQDVLEPMLVEHARSFACAELRFGTQLERLEQDDAGVRAVVVDVATGRETEVRARYLVAADGANSAVRRMLGIATRGADLIGQYLSILFRADLGAVIGPSPCALYSVQALGGPAPSVVVPTSRDGRWVVATAWRDGATPVSSMTDEELVSIVRRAAGVPDLDVTLLDQQLVAIGATVAERFRDGNVFLVGDAAHRTAPTGATGMNTAIHAAHNLSWKLAAVLHGHAGAGLLDSYEPERRPSGERNLLRSLGKLEGVSGLAADLGVVYSSSAVVTEPDASTAPVIEPTDPACVGARAPHVWLEARAGRCSTLDLFGDRLMLLTGTGGTAWKDAAAVVADACALPLGAQTIGDGGEIRSPDADWLGRYGIDTDGAVLVRPDGHIAWRSPSIAADPTATLTRVVSNVLAFPGDALRERAVAASAGSAGRRIA